jgi:hypothetical protein
VNPAQGAQKQLVTPTSVREAANQAAQTAAAPKPAPFRIHSIGSYTRWLKLMVYAEYGEGKTRLCGSSVLLPAMRDVFFIDCESGDTTLATIVEPEMMEAVQTHIRIVRVTNYATLARVHEYLKAHCSFRDLYTPEADARLKQMEKKLFAEEDFDPDAPPLRFYTAILDSLTEAETYSMNELLGVGENSALDADVGEQTWTEYRQNHQSMMRLVRSFKNLPMNFLVTCAADTRTIKVGDSERVTYKPMLNGKLAKQVQGFMDVVGYMQTVPVPNVGEVRRMFVRRTRQFDAKCRFSGFKGQYWDNPTMPSILKDVGLIQAVTDKTTRDTELTRIDDPENQPNPEPKYEESPVKNTAEVEPAVSSPE